MEKVTIDGKGYQIDIKKCLKDGYIKPVEEYIDLDLPSGTLWAVQNASDRYYTFDEAVEMFGKQLPTRAQFCELADYCEHFWDEKRSELVFESNGKELRFPAFGGRNFNSNAFYNVDIGGLYWSCSPYDDTDGYCLGFGKDGVDPSYNNSRAYGFPVRLVKDNFK